MSTACLIYTRVWFVCNQVLLPSLNGKCHVLESSVILLEVVCPLRCQFPTCFTGPCDPGQWPEVTPICPRSYRGASHDLRPWKYPGLPGPLPAYDWGGRGVGYRHRWSLNTPLWRHARHGNAFAKGIHHQSWAAMCSVVRMNKLLKKHFDVTSMCLVS